MVAENLETPKSLLSIKQICLLYGLSEASVRKRIKSGQFVAVQKPGSGSSPNTAYLVVDPGWKNVPTADDISPRWSSKFFVDDVHILTGLQVSKILGCTPRAVRYMAEEGRLLFKKTGVYGRSHRRYSIVDVRRMITMRQKQSYQTKRPGRKAQDEAMLEWAKTRLGIDKLPGEA